MRNGVTKYHVEMLYIQYVAAAPLLKAMIKPWGGVGLPKKHPMLSFKCDEMLGKYTVCITSAANMSLETVHPELAQRTKV